MDFESSINGYQYDSGSYVCSLQASSGVYRTAKLCPQRAPCCVHLLSSYKETSNFSCHDPINKSLLRCLTPSKSIHDNQTLRPLRRRYVPNDSGRICREIVLKCHNVVSKAVPLRRHYLSRVKHNGVVPRTEQIPCEGSDIRHVCQSRFVVCVHSFVEEDS
jgi:hypothetical protein